MEERAGNFKSVAQIKKTQNIKYKHSSLAEKRVKRNVSYWCKQTLKNMNFSSLNGEKISVFLMFIKSITGKSIVLFMKTMSSFSIN